MWDETYYIFVTLFWKLCACLQGHLSLRQGCLVLDSLTCSQKPMFENTRFGDSLYLLLGIFFPKKWVEITQFLICSLFLLTGTFIVPRMGGEYPIFYSLCLLPGIYVPEVGGEYPIFSLLAMFPLLNLLLNFELLFECLVLMKASSP